MVLQDWGEVIAASLQQSWAAVASFVPLFIGAVIVFVVGWIVAVALGTLVEQIVRSLRVDALLQKLEVERALERGGLRLNSGVFLGALVKWFVVIAFLLAAVNILGERFQPISDFLVEVLRYVPNVVVAALILVIAVKVAEVVERTVRSAVEAAGLRGATVGVVIRWAIWVFAVAAALQQLGVAVILIQTLVTGLVAMLALAFGLAFGLGGKEAASGFIERARRDLSGR